MLTLGYLIPGIYLFVRIWNLFIPRKFRWHYIVLFTVLFLIFPLSNLTGEDSAGILSAVTKKISNYLLPFFLYLFLFILLTDIFLLINIIFRIFSIEKIRERSLRIKAF